MRLHILYILFPLLCFVCCSCGDNEPEGTETSVSIVTSDSSLSFGYTHETKELTVTCSDEFAIYSNADWCTCSPTGGVKGVNDITVSVTNNLKTEPRKATITIKSGTTLKEISVSQDELAGIIAPLGYSLVWQDEFNDSRLSNGKPAIPNTDNWWYETGGGGWGNNELQTYIPAINGIDTCAVISDGTLKIIAKKVGKEIFSIRMNTTKNWTYGYFEARLKLPVGKGTWPAFWMMPQKFTAWPLDGEIDIMEHVGYRPNYVSSSIHCQAYYHSIGTQKTGEQYVTTSQTEFHVYALEWTPDYIEGFVDGKSHFKFLNDKQGNKNTWPFNAPFYLKLNLAWGGDWGGAMGVDESFLPAIYEVDYVRVFQKQ